MGNVLLDEKKGDPAEGYQRWLQQNPDLIGKEILSQNKLFRISSFKINTKHIVFKAFFKRDSSPLPEYLKIFDIFINKIENHKCIHLLPLRVINSKQKTFIVAARQKIHMTLEEGISSNPPLLYGQKKWLIYQMIRTVRALHNRFNLYHGHIRTSNFLITSYGYLMLTDFGFYKPLYMFEDSEEGLPEFRLFYGSSYKNCTLAPEKITYQADFINRERSPAKIFASYQLTPEQAGRAMLLGSLGKPMEESQSEDNFTKHIEDQKRMDIFSLACSILEVLRDGKTILTYEDLLKLRKNQFNLEEYVENATKNLEDGKEVKQILLRMLQLNPEQRPQINEVWYSFNQLVDHDVFNLFWHCLSAFSTTSFYLPDLRISLLFDIFKFIEKQLRSNTSFGFMVDPPKCFQSFQALKIFKSILKNKVIYVGDIPKGTLLDNILNFTEVEKDVDSEEDIINEEKDVRRQFFVPLKKKGSSLRLSTITTLKLQKVLCCPEWDKSLVSLIKQKYKGTKISRDEEKHNTFQDMLQDCKKSQYLREYRLNNDSTYYNKYIMAIKIIFSCIRGCKYSASKLIGIELIMMIARQSSDVYRLKSIFPRLISIMDDSHSVVATFAFNSLLDLFYLFIDPFNSEEDIAYYDVLIQILVTNINTSKLRGVVLQRLSQIYQICQWLELHIKKKVKTLKKKSFDKVIEALKNNFGSFNETQVRELMLHLPNEMWVDMFEYFISFLNAQKILGTAKVIKLAEMNLESQKRMMESIDSCIESGLEENGVVLYYAIKYFTIRKMTTITIVKKIAPMILHPHLWVQEQAKEYLGMCLMENPPTRMFTLLRETFQPPFPLQPQDMIDNILLPRPLTESEVDFGKKILKDRKIGLTEKIFMEYLQKMKPSKQFPTTKDATLEEWKRMMRPFQEYKVEPIQFSLYIKKSIYDLFEANFLYYVGMAKSLYNPQTNEEKDKVYAQLHETFRRNSKFSVDDGIISYEKKNFFEYMLTIINTNFEKFLARYVKEDSNNKFKIAEGIYLIMEALYRFQQFNIQKTQKLGDYARKGLEPQKLPRPKGTLVTEIFQHKDIVTSLQKIADTFLISGSYDGTFRVFNTKKIDMNITTDSEAVYEIKSDQSEEKVKINSIAAFENTYSIAIGTNKGQVRIHHIERMPGKGYDLPSRQSMSNVEFSKYHVGGEVQKIVTLKNHQQNECFCYVTAEGNLGIQDIRVKSKTLTCSIGRERGLPRSLAYSPNANNVLIGTVDGYLLSYDVRCNIISNILQLGSEQQNISITGIYPAPANILGNNLGYIYALTYPSKNYELSYFNIYDDHKEFFPLKHFTSADSNSIISLPTLTNRTKDENFKLCSNSLTQKMYYKQLPDFNRNFQIIEHLSDPLTLRESKIREFWMDRCKHRYNQIYSVYNKKFLPFVEHLPSGILTNLNPCITNPSDFKSNRNLTLLVDKKEQKQLNEIEKVTHQKQGTTAIHTFQEEEAPNYLTSCQVFPNMVIAGGWDSIIKIYK